MRLTRTLLNCRWLRVCTSAGALAAIFTLISLEPSDAGDAQASGPSFLALVNDYFAHWFDRVDATLAEQPHWAPPVATTSPRLQEVLRYDIMWQGLKGGHDLVNYGSAKGLEFIPSEHLQFIVGIPPYETENTSPRKSGWGDEMFLMKYRFAAGNEENGNYILTGFMGLSVPNGSSEFSTKHFVYTPHLRAAKAGAILIFRGRLELRSLITLEFARARERRCRQIAFFNTASRKSSGLKLKRITPIGQMGFMRASINFS